MLSSIIADIKSYLKIKIKYPKKFPTCEIHSLLPEHTVLGKGVIIKNGVLVSHAVKQILDFAYIGDSTSIFECESIGKFSCISHGVKIGLTNHALDHIGTSPLFFSESRGWVKKSSFTDAFDKRASIGHDVLISANAMIMNGVHLGHGSVVGAGAFVNADVPPYAIVAGNPAKVIRYRFDEKLIEDLLNSKWWDLSEDILKKNQHLFNRPTDFLKAVKENLI